MAWSNARPWLLLPLGSLRKRLRRSCGPLANFWPLDRGREINPKGTKCVDLENPAIVVFPSPLSGYSTSHGSKDAYLCERVQVSGRSRLRVGSYASFLRVTLSPSVKISERLHSKTQVFFFTETMYVAYVSVKITSGSILRGYGAQSCHPVRIDILLSSSLGKYLVVLRLLLKNIFSNGGLHVLHWDSFYYSWLQLSAIGFLFTIAVQCV
ncbi:hypothetical protein I3760_15G102600 [Carya illinoinensis]|nr:hypothetical protein I3760_15G102600 [Carya illinoinensis]